MWDSKMKVWFRNMIRELLTEIFGEMLTQEKQTEVWLSAKDVQSQFGLSDNWMRYNAHLLTRTEVADGKWVYARNAIQRLFWEKKVKCLTSKK